MAIVDEVAKAQWSPNSVMKGQLTTAGNEILTLSFALTFGFLSFLSAVPGTVAEARVQDLPLGPLLLPKAYATLALLPLLLYGIAALQRGLARVMGGVGTGAGARRGLIWSLMVASPWVLLSGLLSEAQYQPIRILIGAIGFGIFAVNWIIAIRLNEGALQPSQTRG
ncbi:MAG: hypothetical protein AAGJ34_04315 [Pseudomonadota bacterium]